MDMAAIDDERAASRLIGRFLIGWAKGVEVDEGGWGTGGVSR